jgi:type I restriction enzyme, S subunit
MISNLGFITRLCGSMQLPDGWCIKLLDSVAFRGSGHTPDRKTPEYWNGGVKWISLADLHKLDQRYISDTTYSISEAGIANSSAVKYPLGVVVLSRDAGVGKSAITTREMAVSQHFIAWKCGDQLDNHYLYYWLQLMKSEFERVAVGSTIKTIGMGYFEDIGLILPPLPEQRAIAAILSTWDEAITLTTRLIDALKRRKQALMQLVLTGQVRFPGFEGEWEEVEIGDLLIESRISGSTGAKARKLTVKLYGKGVIPKAEPKQGSENTAYYVRKAGQFIYSKLDFLNGAFGVIPNHLDGYETTLDLPAFDISPLVEASYLLNYVSREEFYKGFLSGARGGRKAKRIQPAEFLSASIPLPTMQEQSKMAAMITLLENYEEAVSSSYKAISKQKRGLMQQLLTGAVRVGVGGE